MRMRTALASDIDYLIPMMRQLYEHDDVPFDEPRSRQVALDLMDAPSYGSIWLLEVEGAIAGYCILTFGFSIEYHGRHGFIDELFVLEAWRGRGLGGLAVEHARAHCQSEGMKVIVLEVAFENARARSLYERIGFHGHGRKLMSSSTG